MIYWAVRRRAFFEPAEKDEFVNVRRLLWATCRLLAWMAFIPLFHARAFGQNRVPRKGGVLIASNHESFLDPVLIGMSAGRENKGLPLIQKG